MKIYVAVQCKIYIADCVHSTVQCCIQSHTGSATNVHRHHDIVMRKESASSIYRMQACFPSCKVMNPLTHQKWRQQIRTPGNGVKQSEQCTGTDIRMPLPYCVTPVSLPRCSLCWSCFVTKSVFSHTKNNTLLLALSRGPRDSCGVNSSKFFCKTTQNKLIPSAR